MEKTITFEVNKISEKTPADGAECWVIPQGEYYPRMQVYNDSYNCWDDATGDDYERDTNPEDIWMGLPKRDEMLNENSH